jgi:L-2-hydroxyglutarate oxidase LhgO
LTPVDDGSLPAARSPHQPRRAYTWALVVAGVRVQALTSEAALRLLVVAAGNNGQRSVNGAEQRGSHTPGRRLNATTSTNS